jgi:hypothetical protein
MDQGFQASPLDVWWDKKGGASWLWWLEVIDGNHTRLITRLHTSYSWASPWIVYYLLYDVGDILMMHRCMLGIKERVEQFT